MTTASLAALLLVLALDQPPLPAQPEVAPEATVTGPARVRWMPPPAPLTPRVQALSDAFERRGRELLRSRDPIRVPELSGLRPAFLVEPSSEPSAVTFEHALFGGAELEPFDPFGPRPFGTEGSSTNAIWNTSLLESGLDQELELGLYETTFSLGKSSTWRISVGPGCR